MLHHPPEWCDQYDTLPKRTEVKTQSHFLPQLLITSPHVSQQVQRVPLKIRKDRKLFVQGRQERIREHQTVVSEDIIPVGIHQSVFQPLERPYRSLLSLSQALS